MKKYCLIIKSIVAIFFTLLFVACNAQQWKIRPKEYLKWVVDQHNKQFLENSVNKLKQRYKGENYHKYLRKLTLKRYNNQVKRYDEQKIALELERTHAFHAETMKDAQNMDETAYVRRFEQFNNQSRIFSTNRVPSKSSSHVYDGLKLLTKERQKSSVVSNKLEWIYLKSKTLIRDDGVRNIRVLWTAWKPTKPTDVILLLCGTHGDFRDIISYQTVTPYEMKGTVVFNDVIDGNCTHRVEYIRSTALYPSCHTNMVQCIEDVGHRTLCNDFVCPSNCKMVEDKDVFGTDRYAWTSSICKAAIHANVIDDANGGVVHVKTIPLKDNFIGSKSNGIRSQTIKNNSILGKWAMYFSAQAPNNQNLITVETDLNIIWQSRYESSHYPRLQMGKSPTSMKLTWNVYDNTQDYYVEYGLSSHKLNHRHVATRTKSAHVYSAVLSKLKPNSYYYYRIGGGDSERIRRFYVSSISPTHHTRLAIIPIDSKYNSAIIQSILGTRKSYEHVIYNSNNNNQNIVAASIAPIASIIPVQLLGTPSKIAYDSGNIHVQMETLSSCSNKWTQHSSLRFTHINRCQTPYIVVINRLNCECIKQQQQITKELSKHNVDIYIYINKCGINRATMYVNSHNNSNQNWRKHHVRVGTYLQLNSDDKHLYVNIVDASNDHIEKFAKLSSSCLLEDVQHSNAKTTSLLHDLNDATPSSIQNEAQNYMIDRHSQHYQFVDKIN